MLLVQSHRWCYFSTSPPPCVQIQPTPTTTATPKSHLLCFRRKASFTNTNTIDAVAQIAHNKVLIAAAVSAAVGQLTKPLSAAILYRQSFNIKAVFQAGGFPSTHSSAVVATATSLGLERGFSDAIFGLAIVYASLTMYDAQGVRREVGTHAKALNKMLCKRSHMKSSNGDSLADSSSEISKSSNEPSNFRSNFNGSSVLLRSDSRTNQSTSVLISSSSLGGGGGGDDDDEEGLGNGSQYGYILKESVGHTEIEVIAGALLGFCISLALYHSV